MLEMMALGQLTRQFMMIRSQARPGTNQSSKKTFTLAQSGLVTELQTGTALLMERMQGLNSCT